jgi:type IV secretion system protein VirB6
MQAMMAGVCTTMQPIALAMITCWIVFVAVDVMNGTKSTSEAMRDFFIAGMVVCALNAAQYQQYVADTFLTAVPNTVSAALGGNGSPVAGLDTVLDNAVVSGSKVYEALPSYSLKTIPLALSVIVFEVVSLVSVGFTFAVYMTAAITNVVAVVVGPVFLALAATPYTRRFSSGWLGVLVGGCCTQFMALAVILLLSGAENTMILQTVVTSAGSNSNSLAMLWGLAQCGLLMALASAVVRQIPALGMAIGGGVYMAANGAASGTFGLAATAGAAAVGAARGAAAGAGQAGSAIVNDARAAARPPSAPTGPSLSGGSS